MKTKTKKRKPSALAKHKRRQRIPKIAIKAIAGAATLVSQQPKTETVLVLRVCRADMSSHGGFKWPEKGEAKAPDWKPTNACGNGLHGWLWGIGDLSAVGYWNDEGAKWLVVEVEKSKIIELGRKVKFPAGEVIFCGDRTEAANLIAKRAPAELQATMFRTATAGYAGTATAGDHGTATAGSYGTATAGSYGTATAGEGGTATAGSYGTATAGSYGTATAGDRGTATAGEGGTISILYFDSAHGVYRKAIGEVFKGALKANTAYVVDASGKLVEKEVKP